jgi:hypothetical protein
MDYCPILDMVDYLVAIGACAPILGAAYQFHVIAEITNYVDSVIGGCVVEYKNAVVALRQYLRDKPAKTFAHIEVWNGCNNR